VSDRRPEQSVESPETGRRTDGGRDDAAGGDEERDDFGGADADSAEGGSSEFAGERDDGTDAEPLGDLARRLDERKEMMDSRRGESGEPFDELNEAWTGDGAVPSDVDELFEEMDVSNVDTDALWESVLDGSDAEPVDFDADDTGGADDAAQRDGRADADREWGATFEPEADEQQETVVSKDSHCESCYFFSAPPEVACTYEGSEIVEIVDSERFEVRNCPVVASVVDTDGSRIGEEDELATETSD
jgi:hypothetical protein